MDLVERLRRVPLFEHLEEDYLLRVADLFERYSAQEGTFLTQQAEVGASFVVLDEGECVVRRVDERGMQRPVKMLRAGDSFGTTSLFVGQRRDASVVALSDVVIWVLQRGAFQQLLDKEPSLHRQLAVPPHVRERMRAPVFPWLDPGEFVVYWAHRHSSVLVRAMAPTTLVVSAYAALLIFLARESAPLPPWPRLVLPALVAYAVAILWHWTNWRNDYFAVSTERITHRERVAFLYESRREAPLDRVQNTQIVRGFVGQLLGFGDLSIETAAGLGSIVFDRVPHPERMNEVIFQEMGRAQAMRRAAERQLIREALLTHLGLDGPEGSDGQTSVRAAEEEGARVVGLVDRGGELQTVDVRQGLLTRLMLWLAERELIPVTRIENDGTIIWRKHWIFLVSESSTPLFVATVAGILAALGFFGAPAGLLNLFPQFPFVAFFVVVVALAWLWWQFTDWGNDLYIVTDERIVDIEKRPLFFSEQRREASLGAIQNVNLEIPSFLAATLDFGDVHVQTAGVGDLTFDGVPRPRAVQAEIFQRMQSFRERQRRREAARRRAEMAEWFSVYGEVLGRDEDVKVAPDAVGDDPIVHDRPPDL